jgi:hypothetical protein
MIRQTWVTVAAAIAIAMPSLAFADVTTIQERDAFDLKEASISHAIGMAIFCGDEAGRKRLSQAVISQAMDENLKRGPGAYDAVREFWQIVEARADGTAEGLGMAKVSDEGKAALCEERGRVAKQVP